MHFLAIIVLFFSLSAYGQQDTIQEVEEMVVRQSVSHTVVPQKRVITIISEDQIRELQPNDLGDLLRKISGANLKSYGGLGGLKTVSMRGLGANHTAIVVDGFGVQNTQTGQVNLGQIQTENLVGVASAKGKPWSSSIPVSSQLSGSSILVQSFENTFMNDDTLGIRASVKYGSFNRADAYLGVKYNPNIVLLSAFGGMRRASGAYPYQFENGLQTIDAVRQNNDYEDVNFGGTFGLNFHHTSCRIGYKQKEIRQGLPGAVILYNQTQDERLETSEKNLFSDFAYWNSHFSLRFHATAIQNNLMYSDPDYLNTVGGIETEYANRSLSAGLSARYYLNDFTVFAGTEEFIADLIVNDSLFAEPVRFHNFSILGLLMDKRKINARIHVSTQYVSERNNNGENAPDRFRLNPFVSLTAGEYKKHLKHILWFRNSFRMPTFNELYYNNIGNNLLLPEDAHQFNYGISVVPISKKPDLHIRSNVFVNLVKNKIVAVPTQNLFVWSMQNVGKTRGYGLELMADINWELTKKWKIQTILNYTYQRTLDYTDEDSPTYKHQVAYIPVHTGNFDLSVYFKKTGLRISNYAVSKRYSLNENVPQNKVEGFLVTDLSLFHTFLVGEKQSLNVQFNLKNIFNQSYAYIRSYVMPGTNFLISVSYAFN
jgi:hypothetical protein